MIVGFCVGAALNWALTNSISRRKFAERDREIRHLQNTDEPALLAHYRNEFGAVPSGGFSQHRVVSST